MDKAVEIINDVMADGKMRYLPNHGVVDYPTTAAEIAEWLGAKGFKVIHHNKDRGWVVIEGNVVMDMLGFVYGA